MGVNQHTAAITSCPALADIPLSRLLLVYNCDHRTIVTLHSTLSNMSKNQTATNQATNAHPWKDWKADLGFFVEINNYLGNKNLSFVDVMNRLIDKTEAGGDLGELNNIVVSRCVFCAYSPQMSILCIA